MALCHASQAIYGTVPLFHLRHSASILASMTKPEKQPLAIEADKFIVRLPEGMRDRISEAAKANSRSMNAEIVARLQHTFQESKAQPDVDALAENIAERVAAKLKQQ
jgi:hypothetical protein